MAFADEPRNHTFQVNDNWSKLKEANVEEVSVDTQLDSFPDGGWRAWSVVVGVSVAFHCSIAKTP